MASFWESWGDVISDPTYWIETRPSLLTPLRLSQHSTLWTRQSWWSSFSKCFSCNVHTVCFVFILWTLKFPQSCSKWKSRSFHSSSLILISPYVHFVVILVLSVVLVSTLCCMCSSEWDPCCFCAPNEKQSDLFMDYLAGTALMRSVRVYMSVYVRAFYLLESCRSVIADATLCHPGFALSCEPMGWVIFNLACPYRREEGAVSMSMSKRVKVKVYSWKYAS